MTASQHSRRRLGTMLRMVSAPFLVAVAYERSKNHHPMVADHLNYVASFPVTAMKYGLQRLAPSVFGGSPDIVVSGPNVGSKRRLAQ